MVSGRVLPLTRAKTPAGTRYADPSGNAFMRQGDGAKLVLVDGSQRDCTPRKRGSPWTDAAARGMVAWSARV